MERDAHVLDGAPTIVFVRESSYCGAVDGRGCVWLVGKGARQAQERDAEEEGQSVQEGGCGEDTKKRLRELRPAAEEVCLLGYRC